MLLLLQQQAVMEIVETLDSVWAVASWQSDAVGEVSFKKAYLNVIELFTVVCDAFWLKLSFKGWKSVVELPEMRRTNSSRPSLSIRRGLVSELDNGKIIIISGRKHQRPAVYATTCVARNCFRDHIYDSWIEEKERKKACELMLVVHEYMPILVERARISDLLVSLSLSLSLALKPWIGEKERALMVLSPQASNLGFQSNGIKEN